MTKVKNGKAFKTIKSALASKYFPFITAAVVLGLYYLGWDIVTIYYVTIVGIAMILLLDDLTPLLPHFLMMNVMVSEKNTPLDMWYLHGSDYYSKTAVLVQIAILIAFYVLAMFARLFLLGKSKKFKPNLVFYSLCALAAAFLFNGVGSKDYVATDFAYGLFMAFFFLVVYVLIAGNVELKEENYIKIAYGFLAFSALLVLELGIKYATDFEKIVVDGTINRNYLLFGWGVWNNMGAFLSICIPVVFMLAAKSKYGYLFVLYSTLLLACAFLTGSRQAMLGSSFAYLISAIAVVVKSRKRLINCIVLGCVVLAGIIVIAVKWETVKDVFAHITDSILGDDGSIDGNGRLRLYKLAVEYFKSAPVFGTGFFSSFELFPLIGMTNIIPTFAHNTIMEILGTCGIFGILAYAAHRVITVVAFAKTPSFNKFYISASILTLLLVCLLDNYIFYMLPTLVYSAMLPFATGNCRKEALKPADDLPAAL